MAEDGAVTLYNSTVITDPKSNPVSFKAGVAQMLRGGAILEVSNAEQAKIAEEAGGMCYHYLRAIWPRHFSHDRSISNQRDQAYSISSHNGESSCWAFRGSPDTGSYWG
ncbi:hypothetical protein L6164_004396 [Bauhinia variegata]|uniref:Uncharacterized protein n=1 Tax=Bauhinia variegata TaxID=167791 RepID=A0ACB9Q4A9_BAUVA|nr:hypothetical protein L6164_004396 [Bauhinia variegata]